MKPALVTRFVVLVFAAVLAFGPAAALAAPMMNTEQGAASNMAMRDTHAQTAQPSGCDGCADTGTAKAGTANAMIATYCSVGCLAPALLPSATLALERMTAGEWRLALRAEHSGVIVGIDPYPPNFSS